MKLSDERKAAMLAGRSKGNGADYNAAMKGLLPEQREYVLGLPLKSRGLFCSVFAIKSKAKAVKAKCLDCSGHNRAEVARCTVTICPLWSVRPYQGRGEA